MYHYHMADFSKEKSRSRRWAEKGLDGMIERAAMGRKPRLRDRLRLIGSNAFSGDIQGNLKENRKYARQAVKKQNKAAAKAARNLNRGRAVPTNNRGELLTKGVYYNRETGKYFAPKLQAQDD